MYYYRRSRRSNNSLPLSDILAKIVDQPGLRSGFRATQVIKAWPTVTGPGVARVTTNLFFKGGSLFVNLNSSVVRSDLIMSKDKIIESLNKEVGENVVTDIVFR